MEERIYTIVAKVLDGEATEAERQELDAWLAADAANEEAFGDMKRLWSHADEVVAVPAFNTEIAWQKVASRTIHIVSETPADAENPNDAPAPRRTMAFPVWARYAAAAAVVAFGVFIFRSIDGRQEFKTVVAENGNLEVVLPDQSKVTLHEGATLRYPEKFAANERRVSMTGQAFYDVVHDEKQPFVVETEKLDIRDIGTSFDVDAANDAIAVRVATGIVQVSQRSKESEKLVLNAGEMSIIEKGTLVKKTSNSNDLYWKTGRISFDNTPLSSVVSEISRICKAPVRLDASLPATQRNQSVTIKFQQQSVDQMLNDLCAVTGCKWQREDSTYLVRAR